MKSDAVISVSSVSASECSVSSDNRFTRSGFVAM